MTLNEEKFFKEREELDANKEEEKEIKEQAGGDRPVFRRNYYNNEILDVTLDYLNLLRDPNFADATQDVGAAP